MTNGRRTGTRNPEETRRRIARAAMELHQEVGPAATTITGIAERAGVQRLTVYRHFPDERAVIGACSALWEESHPLPDTARWAGMTDPAGRLRTALEEVYGYFRRGAPMLEKILRDEPEMPELVQQMVSYHAWFRELAGQLCAGWGADPDAQRLIRAAVVHAVDFRTWRSLSREGLEDGEVAAMLARLVTCTADGGVAPSHT